MDAKMAEANGKTGIGQQLTDDSDRQEVITMKESSQQGMVLLQRVISSQPKRKLSYTFFELSGTRAGVEYIGGVCPVRRS
jgi:hypothetical protein